MAIPPLVQGKGLSKVYGNLTALSNTDFALMPGEVRALIGSNGAGKSTTVSLICGLLRADSGEIFIEGQRVGQGNSAVKQLIGLVPQELAIYEELSARENLKLFGALYGLKGAKLKARCDEVLALVNLEDRAADNRGRRLHLAARLHAPEQRGFVRKLFGGDTGEGRVRAELRPVRRMQRGRE